MSIDSLYNSAKLATSPIGALYKDHEGSGAGDTAIHGTSATAKNPLAAVNWNTPAQQAALLASDKKVSADTGYALNQLSPGLLQSYVQEEAQRADTGTFMAKYVPVLAVALGTMGAGSAIGGALAGSAGAGGAAATAGAGGAALGSGGVLTTLGSVAAGGAAGAAGGGLGAVLQGGNIGKGILTGGLLGGVGGGLKAVASPYTSSLTNSGVPSPVAQGLVSAGTGAIKGAIGGAISGQGVGAGAAGGAINGASGSVQGSILSGLGNVFSSGSTALQSNNPNLTNPTSSNGMSDYNFDGSGSYDNSGDLNAAPVFQDPTAPGYNPGYTNLDVQGGGTTLGGGYSAPSGGGSSGGSSSLLSSLASLLGGGGGGGANSSLLAQLLGLGSSALGGSLQSSAAKGAANTFAGQTAYSPYGVSTAAGNTTFNGNHATSTMSPGQQQTSNALNGLTQSSAGALQQGPQAASQQYFNQLQAQDKDSNNKFYQSNLDNQFANGVLSSTAGQYQSQAALGAINQKTANDQVMANNFGQQQQQQQLAQLTAGLNGSNQINQGQLAQAQLGSQIGSAASGANVSAYSPSLAANSNSNIGNLLSTMGQSQNSGNSNSNALLQYLMGKGG